ncbi:MAG: UDP-glucose 4-epimerase GalE [Bacteroidales bacterium]
MQTILITGGTGYIGSHTAVELIGEGYNVLIADNLSRSEYAVLDGIEKITGVRPVFENIDICDLPRLKSFFEKHNRIDAVIHFAAFKAVGESVLNPLLYYRNNIISLINLLEEMQAHSVNNLLFSSSCTVYGQPDELPVTESAPVKKAGSPYGHTKQISEEIIENCIEANKELRSVSLRYFNPIGAHPTALIGELPRGVPDNLVPFITQTAIGLRDEIKVFGDEYNTPDGSCVRDYLHVTDLARAHVVAIKRLLENKAKKPYEVFNLGTGKGVSVLEMIRTFEKVNSLKLNYSITSRRPGDIEQVWADTSYANEELGWRAESSLEETLVSAWKWEQNYRKMQDEK